jgi:hypothetical protein
MTEETNDKLMTEFREAIRRDMSERVKRGMKRLEERGGFAHAAPLGYRNVRDREKGAMVEIDPDMAPFVRQAFELAAAGRPVREILRVMTAKGLRSRRGKPLGPSALRGILTNPFYLGRTKRGGSSAPAAHGPIVGRALWEAAQAGLRARCRNPRSPIPRA